MSSGGQLAAFDREGRFYRGNLHCHSARSDGGIPPQEVVAAYKAAGFDFICLSDHFEAEFGWQVTDTTRSRDDQFTTLNGAELSSPGPVATGKWWLLAAGLPLDFAPASKGETGPQLAERAQEDGAFVALLHPGWNSTQLEDVRDLRSIDAVEIYNHGVQRARDRGDGWYLCEALLDQGRQLAVIASDDAHFRYGGLDTIGGAWVQVKSRLLDPVALLGALKGGAFYSSMGPEIHDVEVVDQVVKVSSSPASVVSVTGPGSLCRSVSSRSWNGSPAEESQVYDLAAIEVATTDGITGCRLSLDAAPAEPSWGWRAGDWWRVTVTDRCGRRAWTNPARLGR